MIRIRVESGEDIQKLSQHIQSHAELKEGLVREIIENIKRHGNTSLLKYVEKFDNYKATSESLAVTDEEFAEAVKSINDREKKAIEYASKRVETFHKRFIQKTCIVEEDGIIVGTRVTPVGKAGLYVPGGKAAYPSTAIMTIIPAVVAGVKNIYIATPPHKGKANKHVLYISKLYGIKNVYKMGGAHAIAAFAYGTESIPRVDVIAGPGNVYVATAKKLVFGDVGIDSVAGPSEICVVADHSANPKFVTADLMSQMEHDEMAMAYLVSTEEEILNSVERLIELSIPSQPRRNIIQKSLKKSVFIYTPNLKIAAAVVDEIAPEHLEILTVSPVEFLISVRNAGAIFLGEYSPEPIGDYIAGPNHTLPTSGTARFSSPLSCDTFMKKSSIIYYTKKAFNRDGVYTSLLASIEGLFAHQHSVETRFHEDTET